MPSIHFAHLLITRLIFTSDKRQIIRHLKLEIAVDGVRGIFRYLVILSAHSELINARYVGVLVIAISTASGSGEEQDVEISNRLNNISDFIRCLNQGRYYNETQFPPQPLLVRRSVEQIEEEGGNEEIQSQLINKGYSDNIKNSAIRAKGMILNYFIEQGNPRPDQY
ncbi:MAG: hypothetical protein EZS28_013604 [Streblomastix strix]|uniref:Uncharacterized protein n=1 Tax=Streblomastix strix TaxID=222440 RepID=A0A5J4W8Q4_9EUKA|nr:MAG: hypothetical protein EZS28_013604 [Streblomastix strix]